MNRNDEFIGLIQGCLPEWFVVPGDHGGCHLRNYTHLGCGWYASFVGFSEDVEDINESPR